MSGRRKAKPVYRREDFNGVDDVFISKDDLRQAIMEWAMEDIKSGPQQMIELGRFLVSVTAGLGGLIVALARISVQVEKSLLSCSLVLFGLALITAMSLATPVDWEGKGEATAAYLRCTKNCNHLRKIWTMFVIFGLGLGAAAIN